jgi:pentatricopeptide repeat protein
LEKARQWFTQLKAIAPVPSSLAYTAIIEACARNAQHDEITSFYEEMQSHSIPAQVDTYRWMLHAYGAAKRMSDAVEVWQHMKNVREWKKEQKREKHKAYFFRV